MDGRTQFHLDAAERHKNLALWLLNSPCPPVITSPPDEWAMTMLFYSAVHLVSAYFMETVGPDLPTNHTDRFVEIKRRRELRPIVTLYEELYDWSIIARYKARPTFSPIEIQAAQDNRDIIQQEIYRLLGIK